MKLVRPVAILGFDEDDKPVLVPVQGTATSNMDASELLGEKDLEDTGVMKSLEPEEAEIEEEKDFKTELRERIKANQ